ncbi:zf-HC2 domain-containing protein [Demequina capsici]|uniref:Zf-HC2 domain-containing protein n=1 Tax=Demequina capsici TaxID=3075620 RepID=A0AA96JF53_9MICO|nr:zf-HC2 domain-containing protein [Demequina sp. PMTSA13]WNM26384.1 zf-HC2 domain-containing protein [Demequina sp. PMTSA13]
MSADHDRLATWDASYVLGALSATERHEYEQHLQGCERCQAAVAELAALPGLLSRTRGLLDPDAAPADAPPPADLAARVIRLDAHRRRRARVRAALAITGAAATVALGFGVVGALDHAPAPEATAALAPVGDSSLTASVALDAAAWGTRLTMTCTYPDGSQAYGPQTYALVVTDDAGEATTVSTWTAVPGRTIELQAGTAVPLDDIAAISVQDASGAAVLEGTVAQ